MANDGSSNEPLRPSPLWHPPTGPDAQEKRSLIFQAVEEYRLDRSSAWDEIKRIYAGIALDAVEVAPEGVFVSPDGRFSALASVYVRFPVGEYTSSECLSAEVEGRFQPDPDDRPGAQVETVRINTSALTD